jgi:hypothetical protein
MSHLRQEKKLDQSYFCRICDREKNWISPIFVASATGKKNWINPIFVASATGKKIGSILFLSHLRQEKKLDQSYFCRICDRKKNLDQSYFCRICDRKKNWINPIFVVVSHPEPRRLQMQHDKKNTVRVNTHKALHLTGIRTHDLSVMEADAMPTVHRYHADAGGLA